MPDFEHGSGFDDWIQKTLTQMNIQLANVLADVGGMTGQAIIHAILAGERDPHHLAAFRDPRVQASKEEIARIAWKMAASTLRVSLATHTSELSSADSERSWAVASRSRRWQPSSPAWSTASCAME